MNADRDHLTPVTADPAPAPLPVQRLMAFTDGVVAIAITLLVLPLVDLVPEAARAHESAADVLTGHLVPLGSFVLSFLVIWRLWSIHHRVFARVEEVGDLVARAAVLWLACIVALPFPVEMVGFYGDDPLVLALYVGILLIAAVTLAVIALALRRGDPRTAPDRPVVEQLIGNAVCLVVAFLVVVAVPAAGFWPLLLLLVDRPVLALVHRVTRREPRRGT